MPLQDDGDLRRRWAEGRLVQLLDEGAGRAALVEVGSRYGIITPVTSLYVPTTREIQKERGETAMLERRRRQQAERDQEDKQAEEPREKLDNKEGGMGTRAKGEEGSMGNPNTRSSNNRYGVQGPRDNPDPHIARQAALKEAAEFGMIGLLNTGGGGDPNAPTAPWGRDDSLGNDAMSARGNMWGSNVGDSFGAAGLGLSGVGEGGGGRGEGIGLGSIGTIGHGSGTGSGQGFGSGHGRLGGDHKASPPSVRMGAMTATGQLPPEVIQRIVRQNFGRFRLCYENGLRSNPNLQGRVSARFVIGRDGTVSSTNNGGSDLPDNAVVSCVVRSFSGLSFPQPESGIVTVVYPINFAPGGGSISPKEQAEAAREIKDAKEPPARGSDVLALFRGKTGLGEVGHSRLTCGNAAGLPLEDRMTLWRERLSKAGGNVNTVAMTYYNALSGCEAPTWRERGVLVSLMLDALPGVRGRVELWRAMFTDPGAANAVYRALLTRIRTPAEMRELHDALGLKRVDPGLLAKALKEAKTPEGRVKVLRDLVNQWPDDLELALRLLDAHEDAKDEGSGRAYARALRRRNDTNAMVRTAVGEYYLRLSLATKNEADAAEARRTFGEIVEFAPDDPTARRRLGDLLRAHGWYDEAFRQYETLNRLAPDDSTLPLLLASAAQGMGKIEEAIRWTERAGAASSPGAGSSSGRIARAFAAVFLAWARDESARAGKAEEAESLRERARRLTALDSSQAGSARVVLTWSHPQLHPTLWSNALGAPMPAPDVDPLLGISQVLIPASRRDAAVELRLEPDDAERAARLGAEAVLTVIFHEGTDQETIVRQPVRFPRADATLRRFKLSGSAINEEI
jgi:tetratricopeptide (TPR) repeat protein